MNTDLTTRLRERLVKWANTESDPIWEDGALRMMKLLWPVIEAADFERQAGHLELPLEQALAELERAL